MDPCRIVLEDPYLASAALASADARRDLIALLRSLARDPRRGDLKPGRRSVGRGRVAVDYVVVEEPERFVYIYRVVVLD